MQFSMQKWTETYQKIQSLGQVIKDSNPGMDEEGNSTPPLKPIDEDTRTHVKQEIKHLIFQNCRYLDACNMMPKQPLWLYDKNNPETHASSILFKYGHLMESGT